MTPSSKVPWLHTDLARPVGWSFMKKRLHPASPIPETCFASVNEMGIWIPAHPSYVHMLPLAPHMGAAIHGPSLRPLANLKADRAANIY